MFVCTSYLHNMLTQCDDFLHCSGAWSKLAYHVNCEYDFSKWHLLFYAWYFEFHANLKKRNWLALFCMRPIGVSTHTFSLLLYWYQNLSRYILNIFCMIKTLLWRQKYFITLFIFRAINQNILSNNNIYWDYNQH